MLGFNLPTVIARCKELVDQAALWSSRARHWARMALTGVGIVQIEAGTISLAVGTEDDVFTYYIVNDDINTMTFYLVSDAIPGTSFQIRNNGFGIVQVQPEGNGIVNSPGTLVLRGHGSVISLIAIRPEIEGVPAMWDLIGDVQPL